MKRLLSIKLTEISSWVLNLIIILIKYFGGSHMNVYINIVYSWWDPVRESHSSRDHGVLMLSTRKKLSPNKEVERQPGPAHSFVICSSLTFDYPLPNNRQLKPN